MSDAGRDGGTGDGSAGLEVQLPAPPVIPWLDPTTGAATSPAAAPVLTPCPTGWREVGGVCDPWPESGPATCPAGQAHFPGEPGCTALGPPCPAGDFADGLPDDGTVIFVRASGGGAGDGTRASPFRSIADAVAVATSGQTIALSKGRFTERVDLPAAVTLRGACVLETILDATDDSRAVVRSAVAGAAARDLTVDGASNAGFGAVGAGAELTVTDAVVSNNEYLGTIASDGGRLVLSRVVVRGTRAWAGSDFGQGLFVQEGGIIEASRTVIEDNTFFGASAIGAGSRIVLTDSVIRDTQPQPDGEAGVGVYSVMDARVELTRVEITGSRDAAIAAEAGGHVVLAESIVRGTRGRVSDGEHGRGLSVYSGGTAEVRKTLFERNQTANVGIESASSSADLVDVVMREGLPSEGSGTGGRGLEVALGASATVTRALIANNVADGVLLYEGTLALEDAAIVDTQTSAGGRNGYGLSSAPGSMVTATRVLLERNAGAAVVVVGPASAATFTDLLARETQDRGTADDVSGVGLDVRQGAVATVSRGVFEDHAVLGVTAFAPGTDLRLSDVVVRGTRGRAANELLGLGVAVVGGARLSIERALVEDNKLVGVYGQDEGTALTLTDLAIRDTHSSPTAGRSGVGMLVTRTATGVATRVLVERARESGITLAQGADVMLGDVTVRETLGAACGDACPDARFGLGITALSSAAATVTRFHVDVAALCGVFVDRDGQVDLDTGEISNAPIGACIRVPEYDVQRLTRNVIYRDNTVNIDTVDFTVPEPEVSFAGL